MAEKQGYSGAIYFTPTYTATTISFADTDPDTILDSAEGFVTALFEAGNVYTVTGSSDNNDDFTVDTVAAGTLTLAEGETLTGEVAGATVTIAAALPGVTLAQFYNWSMTAAVDELDTTSFEDAGNYTCIAGLNRFSATAEKYWNTLNNQDAWLGAAKTVRFFTVYDATPATTTSYYYEGSLLTTSLDVNAPVGEVIKQSMTMTGTGTVPRLTTRSTAWTT